MTPQSFWWRMTRPIAWLTAREADWTYHPCPDNLFRDELGPIPAKTVEEVPESIRIA
jgi:hypothetical protein